MDFYKAPSQVIQRTYIWDLVWSWERKLRLPNGERTISLLNGYKTNIHMNEIDPYLTSHNNQLRMD